MKNSPWLLPRASFCKNEYLQKPNRGKNEKRNGKEGVRMADREHLAELVRRMQAGDENAASELYQASYEDVYYFIMIRLRIP